MTTDKQSGPELNEAIAKALGWYIGGYHDCWFDNDTFICTRNNLPCWSTDDATAMDLLQTLCRERGWEFGWEYKKAIRPYEYLHSVKIYGVKGGGFASGVTRESLAHAISLVILAALEAEKNDLHKSA
jgi:hypothetical protein